MHQARQVNTLAPALPDSHCSGRPEPGWCTLAGGLPADDPPGVHVGGRRRRRPIRRRCARRRGASLLRGNVGDLQPTRGEGLEVVSDQVGRALVFWSRTRRSGRLGAADAVQAQVAQEAFDGALGHVTGTVTLGNLGLAPQRVHLAGPRHRVTGSCEPGRSRCAGPRLAQRSGAARPATAGVSYVLGAICIPASLSVAQIGQAPELLLLGLLGLDVLADQRDGAHTPSRQTSRRAFQDRVSSL